MTEMAPGLQHVFQRSSVPGTAWRQYLRHAAPPVAVAVIASGALLAQAAGGHAILPPARIPWVPLTVLWIAACAGVLFTAPRAATSVSVDRMTRAMQQSLKGLDEMRYALDQAAIVAVTDHRGIITYVNDKFCEISKYSRAELLGQDHRIVNSGYHSKESMRELWRTIARGRIWRGELRNRAKDGSIYWVDTTIVPFLDGRGKPRQYLAIRSDITKRKQAEAQLREQAALTHLGQVTAMVAHEVRNPLAGLRGSLEVIAGRFDDASSERVVISSMIARIDGLNAKISDLLQYVRPLSARLEPIDATALAVHVASRARATMGGGSAEIPVIGSSVFVRADAEMLRTALLNLVLNACEAAGTGGVDIELSAGSGVGLIAVRDSGPGIPASVRARLFEPFVTTRPEGTGLGLSIVKQLIDRQGGKVSLLERETGGTLAVVELPLAS
jgi:two-component system CheB/CheR fusion protein